MQQTFIGEKKILNDEIQRLREGVDIIAHAARLKSYRDLLLYCYGYCVRKEGLIKLEDLPQETKNQIWQEAKKESEGLNKQECIDLSKVVYLISSKL